ncbi:MAG: hypothetical protein GX605_08980 [Chloroflexi bacterium]|nr:hypothetical protein [Chloroflexota bacterium]
MFSRWVRTVLGLALLLSIGIVPAPSVLAEGTTSIRVVKYANDGVTVVSERTMDYTEMQSSLPVQGDGSRTYYHQGPTFDPANLWDPSETVNLKIKGALKGTNLKDLCGLVGGMASGDTVRVMAADGFSKTFDYANVYHPSARQGKIVVAWFSDRDGTVPTWGDGMMLAFFPETVNASGQYVFGNEDMRQTLPENRWHYFDVYPSSNGLTIKNIAEVAIFATGDGPAVEPQRAEMSVSATVIMPEVGIFLSRSAVDYGEVEPGGTSPMVNVDIANTGTRDVSVSLEIDGQTEAAQRFYEESLYIDGVAYAEGASIARIQKGQMRALGTQLKVPTGWNQVGRQDALFIFWAEAAD